MTENHQASDGDMFRAEALEHHRSGVQLLGDLLRKPPPWLDRTYWLLVIFFLAAMTFLTLGRMDEFTSGSAVANQTDGGWLVTAYLPLQTRDDLQVGQEAWFQVEGDHSGQWNAEVVQIEYGMAGGTHVEGRTQDDPGHTPGQIAKVIARLEPTGNAEIQLAEGRPGTLRVRVRTTSILKHLIPALRTQDRNETETAGN